MRASARMQQKQWVVRPQDGRCADFAKILGVSPLVAQVLLNRQISDTDSGAMFLNPKLTDLISPEQMPGIAGAVARIKKAISDKEKITIYGDYDVDGITGVSILWEVIKLLGGDADFYIPHRVDEGYGLNIEAIETLAGQGTQLIITVDCGITAVESAKVARQNNIDLVITDHHRPDDVLPEAAAIVHPALDDGYGNMDSAGAVVAYKVAWALANEFNGAGRLEPHLREFMLNATSLAAMGTVADVMDLRGENRVLTSYGLKSLSTCKLCGVQALIEVAGLSGAGLDSFDIGFRLAPLLNAAGRMGHARLAVELLTSDNPIRAKKIAEYLKEQNNQRRQCETKIFKEACDMIVASGLNNPDRKTIVLAGENWHTGVVGIVASRVVDKFNRPAIMINASNGIAQGSARSVAGFNILEAIKSCGDCLESFGGHSMAAGVTLATEHIEFFAERFESYAQDNLKDEHTTAKLVIDSEAGIGQLNRTVVEQLSSLAPFGQGNPEPMLVTRGVRLAGQPRKVGAKGDHLQIAISDNTGTVRCIGFGMGKLEKKLLESEFFSIAYRPQMNNFNGNSSVQFVLEDVQFE